MTFGQILMANDLLSLQVESCRLRFPIRGVTPPVPEDHQQPTRELFNGWCEYTYTDGRTFFYNSRTGEKSWKPPRRRCNTDVGFYIAVNLFSNISNVIFFHVYSSVLNNRRQLTWSFPFHLRYVVILFINRVVVLDRERYT